MTEDRKGLVGRRRIIRYAVMLGLLLPAAFFLLKPRGTELRAPSANGEQGRHHPLAADSRWIESLQRGGSTRFEARTPKQEVVHLNEVVTRQLYQWERERLEKRERGFITLTTQRLAEFDAEPAEAAKWLERAELQLHLALRRANLDMLQKGEIYIKVSGQLPKFPSRFHVRYGELPWSADSNEGERIIRAIDRVRYPDVERWEAEVAALREFGRMTEVGEFNSLPLSTRRARIARHDNAIAALEVLQPVMQKLRQETSKITEALKQPNDAPARATLEAKLQQVQQDLTEAFRERMRLANQTIQGYGIARDTMTIEPRSGRRRRR